MLAHRSPSRLLLSGRLRPRRDATLGVAAPSRQDHDIADQAAGTDPEHPFQNFQFDRRRRSRTSWRRLQVGVRFSRRITGACPAGGAAKAEARARGRWCAIALASRRPSRRQGLRHSAADQVAKRQGRRARPPLQRHSGAGLVGTLIFRPESPQRCSESFSHPEPGGVPAFLAGSRSVAASCLTATTGPAQFFHAEADATTGRDTASASPRSPLRAPAGDRPAKLARVPTATSTTMPSLSTHRRLAFDCVRRFSPAARRGCGRSRPFFHAAGLRYRVASIGSSLRHRSADLSFHAKGPARHRVTPLFPWSRGRRGHGWGHSFWSIGIWGPVVATRTRWAGRYLEHASLNDAPRRRARTGCTAPSG